MASRKPAALSPLPIRFIKLHGKLVIAMILSAALVRVLPESWRLTTRLLTGWNLGVLLYLGLAHATMLRADVAHIRRRAAEQDEGAFAMLLLSVGATLASLIAIVFELGGTKATSLDQVLLAMATAILSWTFVHTIFALHYAHEYYGEGRDAKIGGLKFPGEPEPDYWDFFYFSLVIGMTSQVSDVQVTSRVMRRMATVHGALSFFFNMSVLALTVNMISNLIKPG